jgi:hypothetical protein
MEGGGISFGGQRSVKDWKQARLSFLANMIGCFSLWLSVDF